MDQSGPGLKPSQESGSLAIRLITRQWHNVETLIPFIGPSPTKHSACCANLTHIKQIPCGWWEDSELPWGENGCLEEFHSLSCSLFLHPQRVRSLVEIMGPVLLWLCLCVHSAQNIVSGSRRRFPQSKWWPPYVPSSCSTFFPPKMQTHKLHFHTCAAFPFAC